MSMKCYICDHEMEEKTTSINTGWGDYKVTISGISAYICPECGEPVDTEYTRIVGFYTPVKTYSKERKAEYNMREWENINE